MPNINRFSVHWFDPAPTRGSELNKVRPCLVVSPDEMNEVLRTVIVAPLTSSNKTWPFRAELKLLGRTSSIAFDQLRAVDKSRLKEKITDLRATDQKTVAGLLSDIFSL